jgi:hypothetical protein
MDIVSEHSSVMPSMEYGNRQSSGALYYASFSFVQPKSVKLRPFKSK